MSASASPRRANSSHCRAMSFADVAAFYKSKRFDVTLDIKTLFYKRHYVSAHGSSSNLNLPGPRARRN